MSEALTGGNETPAQETQPENPFAKSLAEIKSEDGRQKFDSVEKALESIPHAQQKINALEKEKQELMEQKTKAENLAALATANAGNTNVQTPNVNQETPDANKALTAEDVQSTVQRTLADMEKQKTVQNNRTTVESALASKFGEKAKEEFESKAASLNMTPEQLTNLAENHPSLVLSQFGAEGKVKASPSSGTVNSDVAATENTQPPANQPVIRGATMKDAVASFRAHAQTN